MANDVSLLFKITADGGQAISEIARVQAAIKNNLQSLVGVANGIGASLTSSLKGANSASDETAQKLSGVGSSISTLARAATQLQLPLGGAGNALQGLIGAGGGASGALSGVGAASGATSLAMGALAVGALAAVGAVSAIVSVSSAVVSALTAIGQAGVKTNAEMETLRLGIATVIGSVADVRNAEGIKLTGLDAINAALPIASDQLRKLKIDGLETAATIGQIAPAFQAAIGPGFAAGLNIDQIRENVIRLTQAVGALGLPADQLKQEVRAILSGQIDGNAQASIALGITKEGVEEAKKQGKFAEFLEQKLAAAAAAGKLVGQTFAAAQSNLKEGAETFEAIVTEGLFNQLRDKANSILPQIFDKSKTNLISDSFKGISDTLTRVFDTAGQSIAKALDAIFDGIKRVSAFLDQNKETVGAIIESVNQTVIILADVAASVFGITAGATGGKAAFEGVADVMKRIVQFVGFIADGIKIQVSLAFTLGNALRLAVVAPLELAVTILAKLLDFVPGVGGALDGFARSLTTARQAATAGVVDSAKQFGSAIANVGKAGSDAAKRIDEARKRAASGLRAVDGVAPPPPKPNNTTFNPPPKPDDKKKAAEEKARQEAAAELKELQLLEKAKELSLARQQARLKTALDDRLISEQAYVEASIEFDRELLAVKLASLDAEEKAALRTAKNDQERQAKRAEFALKRAQIEQEIELRNEALRDGLRRKTEKAEEDHQKVLLDLRAAADKQEIARIRDLETRRIVGIVNAERRVAEIEAAGFERRKAALEAEKAKLPDDDTTGRQKVDDEIAKLNQARIESAEEATRRIRAAREREIADQRAFQQAITKAEQDLTAKQIEAEKARVEALAKVAVTSGDRRNVIDLRAAAERQSEALRHDLALESLRAQEEDLQAQAATNEEVLRITEIFDQRFEQEKIRHNEALKGINSQQATDQTANDPSSNLNLFGISAEAVTGFGRLTESAKAAYAELAGGALTMKGVLLDAFKGVAQATQGALQSFILTGKGGAQAFKQLAAGIISALAVEALIKVPFQIAEGLSNQAKFLATGAANFQAAAVANFASAKFYAILGGAALGAGLAIGAAGGLGGGDKGGQAAGAGQFNGQQERESKFVTGSSVAGQIGDPEKTDRGPVARLVEFMREDQQLRREDSIQLRAALNANTNANEGTRETVAVMANKITSMSPEDVLSVGVERRPAAIADGVKERLRSDAGFKRDIAEGLLLS